jgi:hypothetical protein
MNEFNIWVAALMTALGIISHVLKKLVEIRQTDGGYHLRDYVNQYPYQTLLIIIGALGGFFLLYEINQLTYASAFGMGFIANSVGEAAGKRTSTVIGVK